MALVEALYSRKTQSPSWSSNQKDIIFPSGRACAANNYLKSFGSWQVFIQRAAVNLLSTVLDTPEFFWSAPDIMQTLYKRICEYMELDDRVEVLNNRFSVRARIS